MINPLVFRPDFTLLKNKCLIKNKSATAKITILKILLPRTLPKASPGFPSTTVDVILVMNSGIDVIVASNNPPISAPLILLFWSNSST